MIKRVVKASALVGALALMFVPAVQAQSGGVIATSGSGNESGLLSPWTDRIFINVNGSYLSPTPIDVKGGSTFTKYDETGTTTSASTVTFKKSLVDISGGVRVINNFGLAVGFTSSSTIGTGTLSASVPHPLVYNSPRMAGGTLDGLDHFESALNVMAVYVVNLPMSFQAAVSAGPTFFKVTQDTIGTVSVADEVAPYTRITLQNPTVVTTTANKTALNVGLDLAWFSPLRASVLSNLGVGVFVRYAGTTMELTPEGVDPISMKVGGFQYGAGLRIRFKIGP